MIAVTPDDSAYPRRLRDLDRPPDTLWIDGDPRALDERSVAIVGTRRMTAYGDRLARELAIACADAGLVVVSGLAQGIDSAAHRGALDGGGRTVAVLGEGIRIFTATLRGRRRPLVPRIRASGAIVSQYAPGFVAQSWAFAKRNATIAALADIVIVVEAGERSGALITADDASRLGRPLFAVPGQVGSAASVGTNALIASGRARALAGVQTVLDALGLPSADAVGSDPDPILALLAAGPLDPDSLRRRLRLGESEIAECLLRLMLAGALTRTPDGRYSGVSEVHRGGRRARAGPAIT
ncbi:MAG TPA: DNA-processing protein DprA [Candidatus Limnocylindria bacterium]|nr:DNA-processing protein DprA [Candidatus Limnocylindria bacterium]